MEADDAPRLGLLRLGLERLAPVELHLVLDRLVALHLDRVDEQPLLVLRRALLVHVRDLREAAGGGGWRRRRGAAHERGCVRITGAGLAGRARWRGAIRTERQEATRR